jgi:streptogramin lyase
VDGGAVNPFHRIDMKTMKKEATYPGSGYQVVVSSKGNPYMASGGQVLGYDVKADKPISVPFLTKTTWGRRGRMDAQDRYWFAMYAADKIAMLDTNTGKVQEWPLRQYFTPYTVTAPDKEGMVWAPSNTSDRLARLNPKTGEVIEYLMPTEMDTKKIAFESDDEPHRAADGEHAQRAHSEG